MNELNARQMVTAAVAQKMMSIAEAAAGEDWLKQPGEAAKATGFAVLAMMYAAVQDPTWASNLFQVAKVTGYYVPGFSDITSEIRRSLSDVAFRSSVAISVCVECGYQAGHGKNCSVGRLAK